jgi:hypothetical protein
MDAARASKLAAGWPWQGDVPVEASIELRGAA